MVFFQLSFSQLTNFNLQVTATNETCSGNGTLSFSVTNTTAGASIVYNIFLLPNTTTPIASTTASSLTGLNSGTYQVVATQTLGVNSNSQQQNTTITNLIQNLTFTISDQKVKCGNDGVLTANVTSGTAVSYELLTGPVTMPAQSSNVFSNLPAGNYAIRVFDNCGNGVVNSFTLIQNYTPVTIGDVSEINLTCSTITLNAVTNISDSNIAFPITVEFKVYPPNNAPVLIYNQVITSFSLPGIQQIIPRYDGNYSSDLKIVDACGNIVTHTNSINKDFSFSVLNLQGCSPKIKISTENAILPYTIQFLSVPAGFNAAATNPDFPGPYFLPETELNVIVGNYTVMVTDACNKTHTITFQVTDTEVPVIGNATNNGCGGVSISIDPIYSVTMVNVTLISAPTAYQGTLPQDLSIHINSVGLLWSQNGFPPGTYVFHVLDSCGDLHTNTIVVTSGQAAGMGLINYQECDATQGSVYAYYIGANISSIQLITAPSNFQFPLPYVITPASNSAFALIGVPFGSYTVQMTSTCGNTQNNTFTVNAPTNYTTTFEIEQFCSSFNLRFTHQGNSPQTTYALQKLNEVTGNWEHPITGNQIFNNQINANNFYDLTHISWNINLSFVGKFRIIKAFTTVSSAVCIKSIQEFEVLGQPKVLNYNAINCGNGFSTIELNAIGIGQLNYRITQKNNQPFSINNGTNNVFVNLEPAIYNFQIEDSCGNILNLQIQINTSFPIQIIPSLCENQVSNLSVNNFSFLQYEWWKDGSPTNILSTTNVLTFNPFLSATHSGTYYLRITHIGNPTSCLNSVKSFTVSNQNVPSAGLDNTVNLCGLQSFVNLNSYLSGNFDTNGTWEELTNSNSVPINGNWNATGLPYGVYKFKYTVIGFCSVNDEALITININEKPIITTLSTLYEICEGENLAVNPGFTNPNYSYQWTGPNSFSATSSVLQFNAIQSSINGQYSLIVDNSGCFSDPFNFVINVTNLPDFYLSETCENNIKTITAIPFEGTFDTSINFSWTGPNGFTSTVNPIQIQNGNVGDYSLVIDSNSCELEKEIAVLHATCVIQNGISPNGDGLNEYFDLSAFDVNTIKIYNRYGTEVYSKENGYGKEWYGQSNNGNILPDATYFYVFYTNSGEGKTGWIYITR